MKGSEPPGTRGAARTVGEDNLDAIQGDCYEHFRHLNEPLFGEIPILYCCPRGPGFEEPPLRRTRGKPFLMPRR